MRAAPDGVRDHGLGGCRFGCAESIGRARRCGAGAGEASPRLAAKNRAGATPRRGARGSACSGASAGRSSTSQATVSPQSWAWSRASGRAGGAASSSGAPSRGAGQARGAPVRGSAASRASAGAGGRPGVARSRPRARTAGPQRLVRRRPSSGRGRRRGGRGAPARRGVVRRGRRTGAGRESGCTAAPGQASTRRCGCRGRRRPRRGGRHGRRRPWRPRRRRWPRPPRPGRAATTPTWVVRHLVRLRSRPDQVHLLGVLALDGLVPVTGAVDGEPLIQPSVTSSGSAHGSTTAGPRPPSAPRTGAGSRARCGPAPRPAPSRAGGGGPPGAWKAPSTPSA